VVVNIGIEIGLVEFNQEFFEQLGYSLVYVFGSKRYPYNQMMTPYEKLKSLPNASCYLKTSTSFKQLDKIVNKINDNEAADRLQKAKNQLFQFNQEFFEQLGYSLVYVFGTVIRVKPFDYKRKGIKQLL
jgi:3'-phosphoadenosine 5'-phosphosulfate sulfotransferase